MSRAAASIPPNERAPAWDIARLFPDQGQWHEGDYLELSRRTNHLVELSDGTVEILEVPTKTHQRIVLFLYNALLAFAKDEHLGEVLVAPYPVRLRPGKFREPDLLFMLAEHADRMTEDFADGADVVMEVVSEDRRRDLETKVDEYAEAGIREYWIVDPRDEKITVLRWEAGRYVVHVEAGPGHSVASALLPHFHVEASSVFRAGRGE